MQYKTIILELLEQRPQITSNSGSAANCCRRWNSTPGN